jgi:hypothetical protein
VSRAAGLVGADPLPVLVAYYRTDKGSNGYLPWYQRHFGGIRNEKMTVLEIGVFEGASLRVWRSYFPASQIVGIDIDPKNIVEPRIFCRQGSQDDPDFLTSVGAEFGPFDIIIDDGSHIGRHTIKSFDYLFPRLAPGGWYVIEDIATAYWTEYEGGPVGMEGTAVAMVKGLVDSVMRGAIREGKVPRAEVHEIHVYPPGIVFLKKTDPVESSPWCS